MRNALLYSKNGREIQPTTQSRLYFTLSKLPTYDFPGPVHQYVTLHSMPNWGKLAPCPTNEWRWRYESLYPTKKKLRKVALKSCKVHRVYRHISPTICIAIELKLPPQAICTSDIAILGGIPNSIASTCPNHEFRKMYTTDYPESVVNRNRH